MEKSRGVGNEVRRIWGNGEGKGNERMCLTNNKKGIGPLYSHSLCSLPPTKRPNVFPSPFNLHKPHTHARWQAATTTTFHRSATTVSNNCLQQAAAVGVEGGSSPLPSV